MGQACASLQKPQDNTDAFELMDDRTRENWAKVKAALEASGKTDCHFYRRAVAVVRTGRDPGLEFTASHR